jgi:hypothetical protein
MLTCSQQLSFLALLIAAGGPIGSSKYRMDWQSPWWSLGCLLFAGVVGIIVFRKTRSPTAALGRMPLFLITSGWLLYIGLISLPSSFPRLFRALIGRSIWDDYHFPADKQGIGYSGTWILVRWIEPLRTAFAATLVIAMVWAIVNLVAGYGRKINAVALSLCALWIVISIYVSLSCFPFCL